MGSNFKERLIKSSGKGLFNVLIEGKLFSLIREENESSFLLVRSVSDVKREWGETTHDLIKQAIKKNKRPLFGDYLVLGRYSLEIKPVKSVRTNFSEPNWIILQEPRIESTFFKVVETFEELLNSMGQWNDFSNYLTRMTNYDIGPLMNRDNQLPLNFNKHDTGAPTNRYWQLPLHYYWITGPLEARRRIHRIPIWEDKGLFIFPDSHEVPIYTNELTASLAANELSKQYKVNLVEDDIECLACFLVGVRKAIPATKFQGALLDEQWHVVFSTCLDEGVDHLTLENQPGRFMINDKGNCFWLVGCKSKEKDPIWIKNEDLFKT